MLDTPNHDNYSSNLASDLPRQTCTPLWSSINFNGAPCEFGGRSRRLAQIRVCDPHSEWKLCARRWVTEYMRCTHACVVPERDTLNSVITFGKSIWGQMNSVVTLVSCGLISRFATSKTKDEKQNIFLCLRHWSFVFGFQLFLILFGFFFF